MLKQKKISVLITGVGGASTGEGLIKALKLAPTPYRIVAIDALPISFGFFEADSYYQVPLAAEKNYLEKILEICRKEKIDILIPGSEPELKKISENRQIFERDGVLLLINNQRVIDLCMDKWRTYKFLKENGFCCPLSFLIEKEKQLSQIKKLPVIIKPARGGGASTNAFIAQDQEELLFFVRYLIKQNLLPLVQEYVGSLKEEYTVGVLTTFEGKLIGSIALKRQILSGLSNKFKIKNRYRSRNKSDILAISSGYSQGIIDDYKTVRHYAEKIAKKLNSTGPINIQCRKTPKGIFVFEINPRFSGTTVMRALVGFNEPDALIRQEVLKEEVKAPINFKKGIIPRGLREKYITFDDIKNLSL